MARDLLGLAGDPAVVDGPADTIELHRPEAGLAIDSMPPAAPSTGSGRKKLLRALGLVVALLALGSGGYYGHYWWTSGRYLVTTDDAYVGAKNSTLSPKVSGYISEVAVEDNAQVRTGETRWRMASR